MKIIVSGPAVAFDADSESEVTDRTRLLGLNGLPYSEDACSNYLDGGPLGEIGIQGGIVTLVFPAPAGPLRVVTEYRSPRRLRPKELKELVEQTSGQWSDGIGEGEFLHRERLRLNVDLYPSPTGIEAVQVDDGVKIRAPRSDPILKAARLGDAEGVKKRIARGADLNARDKYGSSPLHAACLSGHCELAELLLEHGADPEAVNEDGQTPLAYLAMANVPASRNKAVVNASKALLGRGAGLESRDKEGRSPLMWAANRGKCPLIELLLEKGADINGKDNDGHTVLMYAQRATVVEVLLRHGADPCVRNDENENAFEYVLRCTHFSEFKQLVATLQKAVESK